MLLSIAENRICKLNGSGALTWMILEQLPASLTLDEVVSALEGQFHQINSEGELRYEVSHDQLKVDTERFLKRMVELNLLKASRDTHGLESYSISNDISGTTAADDPFAFELQQTTIEGVEEDITFSRRETFAAFCGLLAFDLLLKFAGFKALIKRVETWPTAAPRTADREICKRVRAVVDRAQMYYPKKAMCLQHSAVVTCLLRRRGVPAVMVLAAQEFPPKAHAWAEVAGEVVNDKSSVQREYRILKRL